METYTDSESAFSKRPFLATASVMARTCSMKKVCLDGGHSYLNYVTLPLRHLEEHRRADSRLV